MSLLIPIAVFIGVAALVGGVALFLRGRTEEVMEARLASTRRRPREARTPGQSGRALAAARGHAGALGDFFAKIANFGLLFEQADVRMTIPRIPGHFRLDSV